jgi:hypothetical protein
MIKYDIENDIREIEGSKPVVMTEIASIMHVLYMSDVLSKDDIKEISRLATLSEEESHKEAINVITDLIMRAAEGDDEADSIIKEILGENKDD